MTHSRVIAQEVADLALDWLMDDNVLDEEDQKNESGDVEAIPANVSPDQKSSDSDI